MLKNSRAILNLAAVVKVSVVNDYNYKILLKKITLRNGVLVFSCLVTGG